jgi:hypothetical protein
VYLGEDGAAAEATPPPRPPAPPLTGGVRPRHGKHGRSTADGGGYVHVKR